MQIALRNEIDRVQFLCRVSVSTLGSPSVCLFAEIPTGSPRKGNGVVMNTLKRFRIERGRHAICVERHRNPDFFRLGRCLGAPSGGSCLSVRRPKDSGSTDLPATPSCPKTVRTLQQMPTPTPRLPKIQAGPNLLDGPRQLLVAVPTLKMSTTQCKARVAVEERGIHRQESVAKSIMHVCIVVGAI